jgi:hypothetical protein
LVDRVHPLAEVQPLASLLVWAKTDLESEVAAMATASSRVAVQTIGLVLAVTVVLFGISLAAIVPAVGLLGGARRQLFVGSWALMVISVVAGLFALLALIGAALDRELDQQERAPADKPAIVRPQVRIPWLLQVSFFAAALMGLGLAGAITP